MIRESPRIIQISEIRDSTGSIAIVEPDQLDLPFSIKRVYYLFDLDQGTTRGFHAHKELFQFLIAVQGEFHIKLDNGRGMVKSVILRSPSIGLVVPPGWWREIAVMKVNSVLLVLASEEYCENDYIRDYPDFVNWQRLSS